MIGEGDEVSTGSGSDQPWVRSRPDCLCGAMLNLGQSRRLRTRPSLPLAVL